MLAVRQHLIELIQQGIRALKFRPAYVIGAIIAALAVVFVVTQTSHRRPPDISSPATHDAGQPSHSTRLILLGTAGGPTIRLRRSEPASLLVVDGSAYLIDAGVGSLHNLVAAGFRAGDINDIFITHHHLDHDGGLADIIQYSSFDQRQADVGIYGPSGTQTMLKATLQYMSIWRRVFSSEGLIKAPDPSTVYHASDINQPGVIYEDAKIKVTAAENTHYQLIPPGSASYGLDRSFAYRFDTPDRSIVFTGDTGPSDAVTKLAQGADVLVTEVINVPATIRFAMANIPSTAATRDHIAQHMRLEHMTPEEIGKMAAAARVKMVVLTHFSPGADGETDITPYTEGIRKYYKGPVIAGADIAEF